MDVPPCPNFQKRDGSCERSDLRLLGENESNFMFHCLTCKLFWAVSKDRTQQAARHENRMRKVAQLSEQERERSRVAKVFYNNYDRNRVIVP